MTFAMTGFQAYGVEAEEAVNKRYIQRAILTLTAANTDTTLDIGTYAGTFWTAVGSTTPGSTALLAIKDINVRAASFIKVGGSSIGGKAQNDASYVAISSLDSAASAGGSASETLVVTGLLTTDTILGVTQVTKGASGPALINYESAAGTAGKLAVTWTGNPGASAVVRVIIARGSTTAPVAGTYTIVMNATNVNLPDILFNSGDAPTTYVLVLEWSLKAGEIPVQVVA